MPRSSGVGKTDADPPASPKDDNEEKGDNEELPDDKEEPLDDDEPLASGAIPCWGGVVV
jgi:hypothetical protein